MPKILIKDENNVPIGYMDSDYYDRMGVHNILHVEERTAVNTSAGTFTSGAWRTRNLNTVVRNNIPDSLLSVNAIYLPKGEYFARASASNYYTNYNIVRLQKTSGVTETLITGIIGFTADKVQCDTELEGYFELEDDSTVELQHICSLTRETHGFGSGTSNTLQNEYNVFSQLMIWKLY